MKRSEFLKLFSIAGTTALVAPSLIIKELIKPKLVPTMFMPKISTVITKVRPDVFPLDTILRSVGQLESPYVWNVKERTK